MPEEITRCAQEKSGSEAKKGSNVPNVRTIDMSPTCKALASCILRSHTPWGIFLPLLSDVLQIISQSFTYVTNASNHKAPLRVLAATTFGYVFQRRGWACVNGVRSEPTTHKLRVQAFDATSRLWGAWGWIWGRTWDGERQFWGFDGERVGE